MAVLIEAISVIVRRVTVEEKYPGGWAGFVTDVPNKTLCADESIARIGFMKPSDAESYLQKLEGLGFQYVVDGSAQEIAVADQLHGLTAPCEWLEFGYVGLDDDSKRCAAARLKGSSSSRLITPEGWQFEGSLSERFGYVPSEREDKNLRFLRHEEGVDVYMNLSTGKEVYIGRTS
jgi:hypothetical protein